MFRPRQFIRTRYLLRLTAALLAAVLVFHTLSLSSFATDNPPVETATDNSGQNDSSDTGNSTDQPGEGLSSDPADPGATGDDPAQPADPPVDDPADGNGESGGIGADTGNTGNTGGAGEDAGEGDAETDGEESDAEGAETIEEEEEETERAAAMKAAPAGDYVNVLDYGATPDDGTDDTGAFQDALVDIYEGNTTSRVLYVPSGTYWINDNSPITMTYCDDFTIPMEEDTILRVLPSDGKYQTAVFYIEQSDHITISGGQIIGNRSSHIGAKGQNGMGISAFGVSNLTIENMKISDCWIDGIVLAAAWNWSPYGKDPVLGYTPPVGVRNCDNVTISNCEIFNNRRDNISITGADNVTIDRCNLYDANGEPNQCGILIEPHIYALAPINTYPVCRNISVTNTVISSYRGYKATADPTRQHLTFATYLVFPNVQAQINASDTPVNYSADNVLLENCIINGDMANYSGKNVSIRNTIVNGLIEYYGAYGTAVAGGVNNGIRKYGSGQNEALVRFDAQGGRVTPETVSFKNCNYYRDAFTDKKLPVPTRDGSRFAGWFTEPTGGAEVTADDPVAIFGMQVLYAHWDTTLVTFDPNGEGATVAPSEIYIGEETTYSEAMRTGFPVPRRPGYAFAGWFDAAEGGSEVNAEDTVLSSGDHTLYAHWKQAYTIRYHLKGGTFPSGGPVIREVLSGEIPKIPETPVKTGSKFMGWYEKGTDTEFKFDRELTADLELEANWSVLDAARHPQIKVVSGQLQESASAQLGEVPVRNATVRQGARISMSSPTPDAGIRYVLVEAQDGEDADALTQRVYAEPDRFTAFEGTWYTDEITINKTATIWAIAVKDGYTNSGYAAATYTVEPEDWGDVEKDKAFDGNSITVYRNGEEIGYSMPSKVPKGIWIAGLEKRTRNGLAQTFPLLRVYHHKTRLVLNRDYTVAYRNNVKAAAANAVNAWNQSIAPTVVVTCRGNYSGSVTATFEIEEANPVVSPVPLSKVDIPWNAATHQKAYQVNAIEPAGRADNGERVIPMRGDPVPTGVRPAYGGEMLTQGKDYLVSYANNVKPGTATVYFTGVGDFTGTVNRQFKITQYNIASDDDGRITVYSRYGESKSEQTKWGEDGTPVFAYEKGGTKPQPVVIDSNSETPLVAGTDYTLSYANNVVTITGKGGYAGRLTGFAYAVTTKELKECTVTAPDLIYNGRAGNYKSTPVVRDTNGAVLSAGTDYDASKTAYFYAEDVTLTDGTLRTKGEMVQPADIVPVGAVLRVSVTGKNNYTGEADGFFRVVAADFSRAAITVSPQYYTGKEVRPAKSDIVVTLAGRVLADSDYEIVSYANNINKGTASVTLRGVGIYGREKTARFTIAVRPAGYTVHFNGNRATSGAMRAMAVKEGNTKLTNNAFRRTKYEFLGWSTKPDGNMKDDVLFTNMSPITITKNGDDGFHVKGVNAFGDDASADSAGTVLTLYAVWEEKEYSIVYHLAGGENHSLNTKTTYKPSDRTFVIYAPDKADWPAGYQFAGWYTDTNYKNKVTEVRAGSHGDLHLYAKWTPYNYRIVYHGNNATKGSMKDQTVSYGAYVALTANGFTRTGYAFVGWSRSPSGSGERWQNKQMVQDLATPRNGDGETVHLYAVWSNSFRITYELSGGAWNVWGGLTVTPPGEYSYGTGIPAGRYTAGNSPVRPGYTFAGWYDSPSYRTRVTSISVKATGDMTLYAKWTPNTYTIVYDGNGKTGGTMRNQTVTVGSPVRLSFNAFSKTEGGTKLVFMGWASSQEKADGKTVMFPNGEKTDAAVFAAYPNKTVIRLYAVWGTAEDVWGAQAADHEAHFGKSKYTITFDANAPYVDASDPLKGRRAAKGSVKLQSLTYGKVTALSKNGYTVAGFTFKGWALSEDADEPVFENAQLITGEELDLFDRDKEGKPVLKGTTLYAVWGVPDTGKPDQYSITYNNVIPGMKNKNLVPDPENPGNYVLRTTYTVDDTFQLEDAESLGSTFLGWYSDKACRRRVTEIKAGSVGDRVLYAKWRTDSYIIVYELNGGYFESEDAGYTDTYYRGDNTAYQLPVPVKDGFVFAGWFREKNFRTRVTEITGTTGATVTLYAKWVAAGKPDLADATIRIVPQKLFHEGETVSLSKNDVWITFEEGCDPARPDTWKAPLKDSDFEIVAGSVLFASGESDSANDATANRARATIRGTGAYQGTQMVYFDINGSVPVYRVQYDKNTSYYQKIYRGDDSCYVMEGTMPEEVMAEGARLHPNAFKSKWFEFTGWNTKPDGNGKPFGPAGVVHPGNENDALLRDDGGNIQYDADGNPIIKLYAQWSKVFYLSELTNEPTTTALENQRPIAVMIDNEYATTHYGMSEADVVYEMMNSTKNNRITRYMAIYKDWKSVPRIGNVRSTRPTNALLFPEWGAVLFHEGAPYVHTNPYFSNGYTPHIDGGFSRFPREGYAYEFTSYLTTGQAASRMKSARIPESYSGFPNGGQKKNHFTFNESGTPVDLSARYQGVVNGTTADLGTAFPKNSAKLVYNATTRTYDYYEYGKVHTDVEDGKVLSFKNVILQKTTYKELDTNGYLIYNVLYNDADPNALTSEGWYLVNGKAVPIRWRKGSATDYTRYYAVRPDWGGKVEEIRVDTGKTYIALVPDDKWANVSIR